MIVGAGHARETVTGTAQGVPARSHRSMTVIAVAIKTAAVIAHTGRSFYCSRWFQTKTISSFSTLPVTVLPGLNLPARIICASGFSIQRWIARFNGRAPYTGS